VLDTTYIKTDE